MKGGNSAEGEGAQAAETLLSHLIELRDRILRMFLAVLVIFLALFPFANTIYTFMAKPLMAHLPEGTSMIAIEVAAPFLIPFKLVLLLAVVLAIPYILHQVWAFVAPGLYHNEKRLAMPLVVSSTLLFYLGMAFAYFVVFPLIFAFFTATAPEGVAVMTDISRYLDFIIMLFIAFGIAFEVPIATILLVSMGATTSAKLASKRPYVIVGAFVVGMVLTPPDIISQTLLALPMWVLFEIGLILSRMLEKRKAEEERRAEAEAEGLTENDPAPAGAKSSGFSGSGGSAARRSGTRSGAATGATAGTGGAATSGASAGTSGAVDPTAYTGDHRPLSPEEMDAELDRLEAEERMRKAGSDVDGSRESDSGNSTPRRPGLDPGSDGA